MQEKAPNVVDNSHPNFSKMSKEYQTYANTDGGIVQGWQNMMQTMHSNSVMEQKCKHLCSLSALTAARLTKGIRFTTRQALEAGASPEEILLAIDLAVPAVGITVSYAAKKARKEIANYEAEQRNAAVK